MMHMLRLLCASVIAVLAATAQRAAAATPQELQARLDAAQGTERIAILNELADELVDNEPAKAIEYGQQALQLSRATGHTSAEATALSALGAAYNARANYPEALAAIGQALPLFEKLGDRKGAATALHRRGNTYHFTGRHSQALAEYSGALSLREALDDRRGIADSLTGLGNTYCQIGEGNAKGLAHYQRALAVYTAIGDQKGIARSLNNIGLVYRGLGDYARALDVSLQSLRIEEQLGNTLGIARTYGNIGILYAQMEQNQKAIEFKERARALWEQIGNRSGVAAQLNDMGIIYRRMNDFKKALACFRQALEIKEAIGDRPGTESTLNNLGNLYKKTRDLPRAIECYTKALRLSRDSGKKSGVVVALRNLGAVRIELKEYPAARRLFAEALREAEKLGDRELIRDVHQGLSELHEARGDFKQALAEYHTYVEAQGAILRKDSNDKVAEMQAKYESEKKQREIEVLRRDNEIQILRLKTARLRSYALVAGLFVVVLGLVLLFRRYLHLVAFWRSRSYVGHYRLLSQIGSGGMGVVYKAAHVRDRTRPVAVKVLREEYTHDPVLRQRLKNEAVLIDQLDHPHIVKVYERGEYDQRLFIAMEWLEGRSLAQVIRHGERLPVKDGLAIVRQLGEALATIHSRGIVHRDVKPENVMLVERDSDPHFVKLLDFDVAKSGSLTQLTQTGVILGTLAYLAPEQITRQASSTASDVYSLGVVAYETLTGEQPFFASAPVDVIRQILSKEPIPPAYLRPEVPPDLDALILELLSKEPQGRPSDEALLGRLAALEGRME